MEKQILTAAELKNKLLRLDGETGDVDLRNTAIQGVRFADLIEALSENVIKDVIFDDAVLDNCDFTDVVFEDCEFQRTTIYDAKAMATFQGCNFYEAKIRTSNFNGANLKNCGIENASIQDSDFRGAVFTNCIALELNANNTNFLEAEFSDVSLAGASFIESPFYDAGFYKSPLAESKSICRCVFDGVSKRSDFVIASIGDVGAEESSIHYFPEEDKLFIGLWKGNLDELLQAQEEYIDDEAGDGTGFTRNDFESLKLVLPYLEHLKMKSERV